MAVGDAFGQFLGAAEESRQPASGVEERVTSMFKPNTTDPIQIDDGTTQLRILGNAVQTDIAVTDTVVGQAFTSFIMITNTNFITKTGTTNNYYIGGVQTNA